MVKQIDCIYAYKHDGSVHRVWNNLNTLKETKDYIILLNAKDNKVEEKDNYSWKTKENAVIYFSKHHWFNIIMMFKEDRIVYYSNLATPPVFEQKVIKYIDYELDIKYFSDTKDYLVLDQKEFNFYSKEYKYSKELLKKIDQEFVILVNWVKNEIGPFSEGFRNEWKEFNNND